MVELEPEWKESLNNLPPLLVNIMRAESGLDPSAQNPTSSAGGLGQILDSTWDYNVRKVFPATWQHRDKKDPFDNIEVSLYLYNTSGYIPWCASVHAWGNEEQYQTCVPYLIRWGLL